MIDKLNIENFTVFKKAEFDFVPGINVLVGGNATGKTHVLKLLYCIQRARSTGSLIDYDLISVFRPENNYDLISHATPSKSARVVANWNHAGFEFSLAPAPGDFSKERREEWITATRPVYIPVKDMLANSVGFISLYDQRNIDFDETYRDILSLAFLPPLRETARANVEPLLKQLEQCIEGEVEVSGERFYLNGRNGRIEMHLVAEGWRKLALLYLLIANGSLGNGRVLYWDEPEANLNPSLMDEVVGVLLALARNGMQIFLATHSYIILKELDLQRTEEDAMRLFALERKSDGYVIVHPAETYLELHPNLIAKQFERIYDLEIDRALGGR